MSYCVAYYKFCIRFYRMAKCPSLPMKTDLLAMGASERTFGGTASSERLNRQIVKSAHCGKCKQKKYKKDEYKYFPCTSS